MITMFIASLSLAQDIYVYPNKRLADQGLIEYRRYTLQEARTYQQGSSFEPYLTTSWSNERQLTYNQQPYWPQVISSGDAIYCSYQTLSDNWLYYITSNNAGIDWSPEIKIGDTSGSQSHFYPGICKNNNQLIIVCNSYNYNVSGRRLTYIRSSDNGISWGPEQPIVANYRANQSNFSSVTNIGQTVYASYNEYDHDSIYVVRSWNFGTNWIGRGVNVAYLSGTHQPMTVRASDSVVHLIWVNEIRPVSVRYSRSIDNNQTWSPEIDVAQDTLGAQECFISAEGQHVVISWMGYKYSPYVFTGDLFIKQSFDGGANWDSTQALTNLHKVMSSNVYIKDSLLIVTWMDARFENNDEVMVRYSTDFGVTWSNESRLSYGDYHSDTPTSFSTSDRLHVLWGDRRQANPGLYYCYNDIYNNIDDEPIPETYSYLKAFPNPFNSSVIFRYSSENHNGVKIYNITGQLVKTLNNKGKEGQVIWNGTDDYNKPLSSGIYLVVANTSMGLQHTSVTFLK